MDRDKLLEGFDDKKALFGLFFAFGNRLQTVGDAFYEEITCKQFFLLICLSLFRDNPPTINELSEVMGSSHQNIKQIANKLEQIGFINYYQDEEDKRKLRIVPTKRLKDLSEKYFQKENEFMDKFYKGITLEEIAQTFGIMSKIENNLMKIREELNQ